MTRQPVVFYARAMTEDTPLQTPAPSHIQPSVELPTSDDAAPGGDLPQMLLELEAERAFMRETTSVTGPRVRATRDQYVCMCGHLLSTHTPNLCPPALRKDYPWSFDSTDPGPPVVQWQTYFDAKGCFGALKHYGRNYKMD